jgi:hypothetical protein
MSIANDPQPQPTPCIDGVNVTDLVVSDIQGLKPKLLINSEKGKANIERVIADMRERDVLGIAKYGTPLQPFNGRDPLVDMYQEGMDLAKYWRQRTAEGEPAGLWYGIFLVLLVDWRRQIFEKYGE